MLLTGLQMRTASSPVISKAQSKPRLYQGKTTQHKNTGVLWDFFFQFGPLYVTRYDAKKNNTGLETVEDDYPAHALILNKGTLIDL